VPLSTLPASVITWQNVKTTDTLLMTNNCFLITVRSISTVSLLAITSYSLIILS